MTGIIHQIVRKFIIISFAILVSLFILSLFAGFANLDPRPDYLKPDPLSDHPEFKKLETLKRERLEAYEKKESTLRSFYSSSMTLRFVAEKGYSSVRLELRRRELERLSDELLNAKIEFDRLSLAVLEQTKVVDDLKGAEVNKSHD